MISLGLNPNPFILPNKTIVNCIDIQKVDCDKVHFGVASIVCQSFQIQLVWAPISLNIHFRY